MTDFNTENVEYYEAEILDENCENSDSGRGGLIGVGVALGVGALAAGAAFVANKKGVFDDFKTKRQEKKIERLQKKIDKEYFKLEEKTKVEEKSEEEE